jgi:pimeloyl-ACP methyl ester carboxylesterase
MVASFSGKAPQMFWSAIQIALLVYLGLAAIIFFRQSSFVFQPEMDRGYGANPSAIGLDYTSLKLRTVDGETLDGWHVPAATAREKRGLVLFFHGNAGNISHRLDYVRMFRDLGLATLIIDYRGYGRSSGTPSEEGSYLDAEAAWQHATKVLGYAPDRIVIFGESLGGAVAAQLAEGHRPGALILASTFTSVPDLGAELYPWLLVRLLARIHYDTLNRLPRIACSKPPAQRSSSMKSMAATTKASSLPARNGYEKWTDSCAAPCPERPPPRLLRRPPPWPSSRGRARSPSASR